MAELLRIHQVERVRPSHRRLVHGLENLGSSGGRWPSVDIAKRTRWRHGPPSRQSIYAGEYNWTAVGKRDQSWEHGGVV